MANRADHIKWLIYATLCLALMLCYIGKAEARLSGEVELGYTTYDEELKGQKSISSHAFQQRYSLLYDKSGSFSDGRLGYYRAAVGYEWGSFDTSITTPNEKLTPSVRTGHILYEGDLVIDPAELPLSFHAYSHDMNRIAFYTDGISPLTGGDPIIRPDVTTNLKDGTHINSGATLVFGVKNSLTNGYNRIFHYFPMLMLDYRDEIIKDTKSLSPVDSRLKRLAFVSLNKKDNWFHYRTSKYEDYINPNQSWEESQFQLGTVDHALQRRWIDLTNWLKISTDGQFTRRVAQDNSNSFEMYEVNLFGIASRQNWEARSFNSFTRTFQDNSLRYERNIPLYLNGNISADTDWRARFSSRDRTEKRQDGQEIYRADTLAALRVDTFKRANFTLSPSFTIEHTEDEAGKNLAVEASVETASTRRFSNIYGLYGSYSFKSFNADGTTLGSASYLNQSLVGRATYTPSNSLALRAEERVEMGSGTNPQIFSGSSVQVNSGLSSNSADLLTRRDNSLNDYVRSVTTLGATWNPLPRLTLSLTAAEDVLIQPDLPNDYLTTITNSADYTLSNLRLRMDNRYSVRGGVRGSSYILSSRGLAGYTPNRYMDASLNYTFEKLKDGSIDTVFLDLQQKFSYYFYRSNGVTRRVVELFEEADYSKTNRNDIGTTSSAKRLTLGAKYYPLSRLYLAATARYSLLDPGSIFEQYYSATIGLNYRTLQASLDYSYGRRNDTDNRIEKRFSANLKKFF